MKLHEILWSISENDISKRKEEGTLKYFLIAGERSGDLHGSFLIEKILQLDTEAEVVGYGGSQMEQAGMELISHYREISFMGFLEVIQNLRLIAQRIKACERAILEFQPDVLILIDFPGFNLRIARFAKANQFKVAYYIAPKVWAWKESRVEKIKKYVDRLYSILPFETTFFQKHDYSINYVGNPVVEEIQEHVFAELHVNLTPGPQIAYLPGSRAQEVKTSIEMIIECARLKPDYQFLVAAVDNVDSIHYKPLEEVSNVEVILGKTYEVLKSSEAAIVTSGTATLEAALLHIPQVVCYKTSKVSYWIAKVLIKVRFLSLVNLIQNERILQEYVQDQYTPEIVLQEVDRILENEPYRQEILANYRKLRDRIGDHSASMTTASDIIQWLKN